MTNKFPSFGDYDNDTKNTDTFQHNKLSLLLSLLYALSEEDNEQEESQTADRKTTSDETVQISSMSQALKDIISKNKNKDENEDEEFEHDDSDMMSFMYEDIPTDNILTSTEDYVFDILDGINYLKSEYHTLGLVGLKSSLDHFLYSPSVRFSTICYDLECNLEDYEVTLHDVVLALLNSYIKPFKYTIHKQSYSIYVITLTHPSNHKTFTLTVKEVQ